MSAAKILITGMSNAGKTTLLKTLQNCLVISRDGKPFSLPLPHVNIPDYENMDDVLAIITEKLEVYKKKTGEYPDTIVFDSASRIFTDVETYCLRKYSGYDVWSNVNKEMTKLLDAIRQLQDSNNGWNKAFNIVIIAHIVWDAEAKRYIETCKGSFAKIGGFLSTVDYAINIDLVGKKRIVTHHGNNLSRTLIEGMPEKEEADNFNLQEYLDKVRIQISKVTEQWSI